MQGRSQTPKQACKTKYRQTRGPGFQTGAAVFPCEIGPLCLRTGHGKSARFRRRAARAAASPQAQERSVRFVRRTACAPFGHFEKARHSTLRRAGKEPSACPQPHRAAVPAGPASYTAVGPAPAGTPYARSERHAAWQAFPAGQAKRRLSGVGRADCAVFNGPVALHKDMAQEGGTQAVVASGRGLPYRDTLRPFREARSLADIPAAGQAKRRLSGVGRADCAVFNGPVALHKDMDQKGGIQAIVASGRGLLRRDAPRPSRETRGGPPFRELCPVQAAPLCTVRAAAIVPCPCGACPCSSMGAARRPAGIPGGTGKASLAE